MTEPIDIAARRKLLNAASPRPWFEVDREHYWQLFASMHCVVEQDGERFEYDGHPLQLIKARKEDDQYAPYWPRATDAALIVAAVNDYGTLLDALAEILAALDDNSRDQNERFFTVGKIVRRTVQ